MSHTDRVKVMPSGFEITAKTEACPIAAYENEEKKIYGVQFHPEVTHTQFGFKILHNFLYNVCGCHGDWKMDSFIDDTVKSLREKSETKGYSRPFGRCRFLGRGGTSLSRRRQTAHLRFR